MLEPLLAKAGKYRLIRLAEAKIVAGSPAPDFTLKTADDKNFTLSSLRGKYIVLDFWGSWCGWCIKGIPKMKRYYDRYKSKLEIVGIDCNDTRRDGSPRSKNTGCRGSTSAIRKTFRQRKTSPSNMLSADTPPR